LTKEMHAVTMLLSVTRQSVEPTPCTVAVKRLPHGLYSLTNLFIYELKCKRNRLQWRGSETAVLAFHSDESQLKKKLPKSIVSMAP
jgi:hypothetical protein